MGYRLGIDLGTTFTAAAILRDGRPELFPLGDHGLAVPSVVLLRPDGTFAVGDTAERQGLAAPHRLAREFKRRTGDPTPLRLAGTPYSAHSLTATLLRWVVQQVTRREAAPPDQVVVTHPANWGPFKRELLQHATSLADLDDVLLCTEPEAAALHYASLQRLQVGDVVAVYDLGGGTFDTAVLARTASGFELLGNPVGIEQLGGVDFDDALFHHVLAALGGSVESIDPADEAAVTGLARLRRDCVVAKEALSEDPEFAVPVNLPGLHTQVRVTRGEFEDLVRPPVVDTVDALRRALRSARVDPQDLSAVLLAGGSSRIPLVAGTLSAELGRPVSVDAHPKHLVALGAARYTPTSARPGPLAPAPPPSGDTGGPVVSAPPQDPPSPAGPVLPVAPGTGDRPAHVPPAPRRRPGTRRPLSALTLPVRASARAAGSAVRASSRRMTGAFVTGGHGVVRVLRSLPRALAAARPALPVVGAVAAVALVVTTVIVVVRQDSPPAADTASGSPTPTCAVSSGPDEDAIFDLPPPSGRGDRFHVEGGKVHTWLHASSGALEMSTTDADDPCYPYGEGRWGAADVSGDGRADLVHVTSKGINSWIARGPGAYDVVRTAAATGIDADDSGRWGAADVDADRDADLVHISAEGIRTWTGDGRGGFTVGSAQAGPRPAELLIGQWRTADVDGDRRADLVHVDFTQIETWFSRPGGTFDVKAAPQPRGSRPGKYPYGIGTWLTGDVTADGRADLVHVIQDQVERGDTTSRGKGAVTTWVTLGDGRYEPAADPQEAVGRYYRYKDGVWFAANVDADAAVEIVQQNGPDATVWRWLGDGRYQRRSAQLPQARKADATVAWQVDDLQRDRRADLVQIWDRSVETWTARPDGGFTRVSSTAGAGYAYRRGVWLGASAPP